MSQAPAPGNWQCAQRLPVTCPPRANSFTPASRHSALHNIGCPQIPPSPAPFPRCAEGGRKPPLFSPRGRAGMGDSTAKMGIMYSHDVEGRRGASRRAGVRLKFRQAWPFLVCWMGTQSAPPVARPCRPRSWRCRFPASALCTMVMGGYLCLWRIRAGRSRLRLGRPASSGDHACAWKYTSRMPCARQNCTLPAQRSSRRTRHLRAVAAGVGVAVGGGAMNCTRHQHCCQVNIDRYQRQ